MSHPMYQFSLWLHDQYVEAEKSHNPHVRNREYASILYTMLKKHLELNLQIKRIGYARQHTKRLIRDIERYRKDPEKYPLDYCGPDANALIAKNQQLWEAKLLKWENEQEQAIALLSDQTEIKSLKLIGKILKSFDGFQSLQMTSMDDAHICGAANMLLSVLEKHDYKLDG